MFISNKEIPVAVYYDECLRAAKRTGYFAVVTLAVRKADSPAFYDEVVAMWTSLHDLTGNDFLVLFSGREGKGEHEGGVQHRWTRVVFSSLSLEVMPASGLRFDLDPDADSELAQQLRRLDWRMSEVGVDPALRDEVLSRLQHETDPEAVSRVREHLRMMVEDARPLELESLLLGPYGTIRDRPPGDYDVTDEQSLNVSGLCRVLGQLESAVPFIHVAFLATGRCLVVPLDRIQGRTFYGFLKHMMSAAAPFLAKIRAKRSKIDKLKREHAEAVREHSAREREYCSRVQLLRDLQTQFPTGTRHTILARMYEIIASDTTPLGNCRREYYDLMGKLKQMEGFPWREHRKTIQGVVDQRQQFGPPGAISLPPALNVDPLQIKINLLAGDAEKAARKAASYQSPKKLTSHYTVDCVVLTVIPAELNAVCRVLGIEGCSSERRLPTGSIYRLGSTYSTAAHRQYAVAVGCLGNAGNYDSGVATTEAIQEFKPKCVALVGIAAGMRKKVRIGQPVLSQRIVAYELGSVERRGPESVFVPRPEIDRVAHAIEQDMTFYVSGSPTRRIMSKLSLLGEDAAAPSEEACRSAGVNRQEEFAWRPKPALSTLASGEKLLRDESKLRWVREDIHGKVEIGEMEAVGLAAACRRFSLPWVVVRGVSDFGDPLKNDQFHRYAASVAAATFVDFLEHGLHIGEPTADWPSQIPPLDLGQSNKDIDLG